MGKLYLVPTPIGNLGDITYRAIEILKKADYILAEDTRTTSILLRHYEITTKTISFHQHNEHRMLNSIVQKIALGNSYALVSDAGTPGISDPGFLLVRECLKNDIIVECLPGATALIPALVMSGFPSDSFVFEGFLPFKRRQTKLKMLALEERTIVFYESPHKLLKTLEELKTYLGSDRKACVSRELTKIYEENIRGTLAEIIEYFSRKPIKGEIVIVVEGKNFKQEKREKAEI